MIVCCPCKNDLESLNLMVKSLLSSTSSFDKLIILDGGSTDGTIEFGRFLMKTNNKVIFLEAKLKSPLKAYNLLFNIAKDSEQDVLMTQTDVIFPKCLTRDWLKEMQLFAQNDLMGAIIPFNGGGISGEDYIEGFQWLGGWCTYFPLRTLQLIGGYDESFPNGMGVDIDHSYQIYKKGLKVGIINYWVDHHQTNAREHDRDPDTEKHKKDSSLYFKKKWSLNVVD